MKKLMLTIAGISMLYCANAWETPGVLTWTGPHTSVCNAGVGVCQASTNPNDPSPSVGDQVKYKDVNGQPVIARIIGIDSAPISQLPPPPIGVKYIQHNGLVYRVSLTL